MSNFTPLIWNAELIKRFWSYQAQFPESFFSHQAGSALLKVVHPHLIKDSQILDYGCGGGSLIAKLLEKGYQVAGTDFAPAIIDGVGRKFKDHVGFLGVFNIEKLIAEKRRFNIIFVTEIIEHLGDPELDDLFMNLCQLLYSDGKLIITTPNEENLAASYVFCPNCEHYFHRMQHLRSWSRITLSQFLSKHGYTAVQMTTTDLWLHTASYLTRLKFLLKCCLGYRASKSNLIAVAQRSRIF